MQTPSCIARAFSRLKLFGLLLVFATSLGAQTNSTGVNGRVSNAESGDYLEGARVTLVGTERSTLTTRSGEFEFLGLSPGNYELVVNYAGLDAVTVPVVISAGNTSSQDVKLSSEVYRLSTFEVTGIREGNAAATTAQKNAPNLANIISTDAYGNVADGNLGNLLQRLPGVDQVKSNGDIQGFGVRGIPQGLSTVSLDGATLSAANAGPGPVGDRAYPIDNLPAELISTVKLTKASTPDMAADSLGGNLDLVTKSALDVEGRRITYRVAMNNNSYRGDTEWTPTGAFTYLDTFGANRNFGLTFTGSYSKTTNTRDRLQNSLAFAPGTETVVNGRLRLLDDYFTRERTGFGFKLDHKVSDRLMLNFDVTYTAFTFDLDRNDYRLSGVNRVADYSRVSREAIFAGTVARTTSNQTASLAPGFTDTYEERLNATAQYLAGTESRDNRMFKFGAGGKLSLDDGWLTFKASRSDSDSDYFYQQFLTTAGGSTGYSLDLSEDRSRPKLTQLYGPTMFAGADLSRYTGQYMAQPIEVSDVSDEARADWRKNFNQSARPFFIQSGAAFRRKDYRTVNNAATYNYLGADGVAGRNTVTGLNDDNIAQFRDSSPGYGVFRGFYPSFDTLDIQKISSYFNANRSQFSQLATDLVRPAATLDEKVASAYAMSEVRFGSLAVLGGLRAERTDLTATGSLQLNSSQNFDLITREASYTDWFPGVHVRYEFTPNLLLRASWSTGIGRPSISQQLPTTTITTNSNTGLGSVNSNNTNLRPMFSNNYDVALEYYFKQVGVVSVGAFQKKMKDFIAQRRTVIGAGTDNGFGGQYEGFDLVTQENLSDAEITGAEFNYSQMLTFLPGVFKGTSVFGNATYLDTSGQFTDGNAALPGFKPILANLGFTFKYSRFLARASYNYQAGGLASFNADPTLRTYSTEDKSVDVTLQYQVTRRFAVFADASNIFNYSPGTYIINKRYVLTDERNGTRLTVGISGRF